MNRDLVYLQHILDAIERIERYVAVGHERFVAETLSVLKKALAERRRQERRHVRLIARVLLPPRRWSPEGAELRL